jgi:hypothetical protein
MIDTTTTMATPNPSAMAVTGAGGVAALLGWGATLLGAKLGLPPEVAGAVLATVISTGTSIWHHFFGPAVAVTVPKTP